MSRGFEPFTSLNAVTAIGAGSARDLEDVYRAHTLIATATGNPVGWQIKLEGSHDGTNFAQLAVVNGAGNGPVVVSASSDIVQHVRASLSSLSGGTSPTVTATIATEGD